MAGQLTDSAADSEGHFPTTRWSLLRRIGGTPAEREDAIGELFQIYHAPIRRLISRRIGVRSDEVDEIAQDFLVRKWIRREFLQQADPGRGRFRDLLRTSVRNFVSNWIRDRVRARRRDGQYDQIDDEVPDTRRRDGFDVDFARVVVEQAIELFRRQCHDSDRHDLWTLFDARIAGPTLRGEPLVEYEQLVPLLSLKSPKHATNLLVTAKRSFMRAMQAVVAGYERPEDLEVEVEDLMRILGEG